MRRLILGLGLLVAAPAAHAQQDTTELARLRAQLDAITRELERLQLGPDVAPRADSSVLGFGPAASKVYRVRDGVSIGGYGEVLYENFATNREDDTPSGAGDRFDALRGIVYVGYKFNDRWVFNSEIEFEHGSTDQAGSVSLEFAYLDYHLAPSFGLRAGLLLIPMGIINEQHEPPTFLGTERPETERVVIPSTWRENGVGVFGGFGNFAYRAYLVNGFDGVGGGSADAGGFSAGGLRGGRQKGSKAAAETFAGVGRLDYMHPGGWMIGGSLYYGQAGQNNADPADPTAVIQARTVIWEGHVSVRTHGFDVRGLVATANLDDVDLLNQARGLTGSASIGERLVGWYGHVGYDVLRAAPTAHQLIPYLRYEQVNTQDRVPAGFTADPANDREIVTIGLAWKPQTQIALKADYQIHRTGASTGVNQWNIAVGYLF